jgi:hypothetical protein
MADYDKWFKSFNRTSFEKDGATKVYGNDMEDIYQMFKARLADEASLNIFVEPVVKTAKVV